MGAVVGTIVPVLLGWLVLRGFGFDSWPNALVAGAALCPTSLGVAAKMLKEVKATSTNMGQLICASAVLDDVLSLILLGALTAMMDGKLTVWTVLLPTLGASLYLASGFGLATRVPRLTKTLLSVGAGELMPPNPTVNPRSRELINAKITRRRENMVLTLLLSLCLGLSWLADLFTSFLLGAFVAGMAFSGVDECAKAWKRQVQRLTEWMARMFFACAIGFAVPVQAMLSLDAVIPGLVLAMVAVVGKLVCGVFAIERPGWKGCGVKVGWAMVPRGEFAFIILGMAKEKKVIGDVEFSAVVWAILLATFFAPFAFRMLMMKDRLERLRLMHLEAMEEGQQQGLGLSARGEDAQLMGGVVSSPVPQAKKKKSLWKTVVKTNDREYEDLEEEDLVESDSVGMIMLDRPVGEDDKE